MSKDLGASADADRDAGLRPQPASQSSRSSIPSAWRTIADAPRDGTLFIARNADHPEWGSWPMQRNVRWSLLDEEWVREDRDGWLHGCDIEPDYHEGHSTGGAGMPYSLAVDEHNTSVRYEWQPLPSGVSLRKTFPGGAPDEETFNLMGALDDLQTWTTLLMTRQVPKAREAYDLVQQTRAFIVERVFHAQAMSARQSQDPQGLGDDSPAIAVANGDAPNPNPGNNP